jgi:hypothetical protein
MKAGGWRFEDGGWRLEAGRRRRHSSYNSIAYAYIQSTEHEYLTAFLQQTDTVSHHQGRSYSAFLGLPFKPRVPVSWLRTGTGAWTKHSTLALPRSRNPLFLCRGSLIVVVDSRECYAVRSTPYRVRTNRANTSCTRRQRPILRSNRLLLWQDQRASACKPLEISRPLALLSNPSRLPARRRSTTYVHRRLRWERMMFEARRAVTNHAVSCMTSHTGGGRTLRSRGHNIVELFPSSKTICTISSMSATTPSPRAPPQAGYPSRGRGGRSSNPSY